MMKTLIFISISVMSCSWVSSNSPRCTFNKEVIVRPQDLKRLESFKYSLGPVSRSTNEGCKVTLTDNEILYGGKPCRNLMGQK